jgi:hypothetical protein
MRRETGGRRRFMVARLIGVNVRAMLIADGLRNSIAARTALGTSKSITLLAWAETENDRIALHQQNKHGNASRSNRQKPLPDPCN